jgi:hypothetical protein
MTHDTALQRHAGRALITPRRIARITVANWPVVLTVVILWSVVLLLATYSRAQTGMRLVYALDDPYIHMSMAKNVATHGVWGVTRHEFSSSSSSLLWTLLLSVVYAVVGVSESAPLLLNIALATAMVLLVDRLLSRADSAWPVSCRFVILLAIGFLTPLPALIFSGMEHILHTILAILFLWTAAATLQTSDAGRPPAPRMLWILAAVLPAVRYEALFMVVVVTTLFALRRRWFVSVSLLSVALAPIAIYGLVSVAHGWFVLPNALLLKTDLADVWSGQGIIRLLGYAGYERLRWAPHIVVLVTVALLLFIHRFDERKGLWDRGQLMLVIYATSALLHMQFAATGWFFRYEAYLVALGLFTLADTSAQDVQQARREMGGHPKRAAAKLVAVLGLSALAISPLLERGVVSLRQVTKATRNIYEQHYQMGMFLKTFYSGAVVAANDIGAITFLADIRCVDLWGLGSRDVGIAKWAKRYDRAAMALIAQSHGVGVAIVYDQWFPGGMPQGWHKAGEWTIEKNVVAGGDTVSFYATAPAGEHLLAARLRQFASRLPSSVRQGGRYTWMGESEGGTAPP